MKVWHCDDSRPVPGLVQAEVVAAGGTSMDVFAPLSLIHI